MFTFLASLVELVGILLKSIIKSCAPHHHHGKTHRDRKKQKTTSVQSYHQDPERPNDRGGTRAPMPKKPRRASLTERTVSSSERTVIFELAGSSSSPDETKT